MVPVRKPGWVFHPKLALLLGEKHAEVICGSNNLTQPGSTHNLELLNRVPVRVDDGEREIAHLPLVREAIQFFKECTAHGEAHAGRIAMKWLEELEAELPWLGSVHKRGVGGGPVLVHTLRGGLWDWMTAKIGRERPQKIQVISPFYDSDLALLKRVRERWPDCPVEVTAQQNSSNLHSGFEEFVLPPELSGGFSGAVLCYLLASKGGVLQSSVPMWLIQEHKLTHDPMEGGGSSGREADVRETGRGLVEHLDQVGDQQGQTELIRHLMESNIRYQDESRWGGKGRGFRVKIRDPFHPDTTPDWLKMSREQFPQLEQAIYDFADRHQRRVLEKHERKLHALLLVAQVVRCGGVFDASRVRGQLSMLADRLEGFQRRIGLTRPTAAQVRKALEDYEMLTHEELALWMRVVR